MNLSRRTRGLLIDRIGFKTLLAATLATLCLGLSTARRANAELTADSYFGPGGPKLVGIEAAAGDDRFAQSFRISPTCDHRHARVGGGQVDVTPLGHAREAGSILSMFPSTAWFARRPMARANCDSRCAGQSVASPGDGQRFRGRLSRQLRPRRDADHFENRLQRRHLPRLGPRQERLQALAARLRSIRRSSGPDRRSGRPAIQSSDARAKPDAAEAERRRCRTSAACSSSRASRITNCSRPGSRKVPRSIASQPARGEGRNLAPEPDHSAAEDEATVPRHGDLYRRHAARRHRRGVRRKRQHRNARSRQDGSGHRPAPRRSGRAGPLRRKLRRHDGHHHGRPLGLRLEGAAGATTTSTSSSMRS